MTNLNLCLALSVLLLSGDWSRAADQRSCGHCGCCLRKVVRMECTTEDVIEHAYDCRCEDFALLGPSTKCHGTGPSCQGCCDQSCSHHDKVVWQPGHCGKPRTRKMLVKYEVVKKVPAYRCVVEHVCDRCGAGASSIQPAEELPPIPLPPASTDDRSAAATALPLHRTSLDRPPHNAAGFSWKSIFGG